MFIHQAVLERKNLWRLLEARARTQTHTPHKSLLLIYMQPYSALPNSISA